VQQVNKPDHPNKLCNFIKNGEECKFKERCIFSHDLEAFKNIEKPNGKPMCRNGLNCENRKCTFIHPLGHKKAIVGSVPQENTRTPHSSPKQNTDLVDKKYILCKNMFKVEGSKNINGEFVEGEIKKIGECKFGNKCIFAHDWIQVRDEVNNHLDDFKCVHAKCRNVTIMTLTKVVEGKERKTRRYLNIGDRKCFKIHEKETIKHFIMRTHN
jgi:hypothetical protein